jgi:hypothetical protein
MSRYSCTVGEETIAFGFDQMAVGYFYQKFSKDDEVIEDKCSMFDRLTNGQLLTFLDTNLTEEQKVKFDKQIKLIALDLPF